MKWLMLPAVFLVSLNLWAADLDTDLLDIQTRWAKIQYQTPEDKREKAFEKLSAETEAFVSQYPGRAEPLIWQGIVLSTYAGAKGGLGALGLVKQARKSLEKAVEIDPNALDGSALTSLGSLYYQVPGWPLSFGDDDKAKKYLQRALTLNPEGIDANFFFGDYLLEQGENDRAKVYLSKVLEVPGRPGRALADEGRRREAKQRLENL
ncbi:MAG: hypothetical protein EP339_09465 [Gammaproteobacteria bacterium]|uniref:Uncharacterized protein n=1 Tax=Marinobacter nitratireducens TaxID=1137280 RepID=A0A072MZD0_9GAMM|nr:hypothetical protein [Marinobacter nitratireducens]KEF30058.1 hypothetical protein D777_03234 [Marinobacter nitratireducens]TNE75214.1 MAG: hypothetical protein EP339_09465 [Gammaproteobacteria bacterium]